MKWVILGGNTKSVVLKKSEDCIISSSSNAIMVSSKAAILIGSITGGVAFLILVIVGVFLVVKYRRKSTNFDAFGSRVGTCKITS